MFDAKKVKDGIVRWIRDYFDKNGRDCNAVIGISGGKDSTIVAALCAEALGADRVYGVLMPQGEQKDVGISHQVVKHLGIRHSVINIKDSVDAIYASMPETCLPLNRQVWTNVPARVRMAAVYAVSAVINGRVACTNNLSEDFVGYTTKFGIGVSGDFSPVSRLTVTEIKAVGKELELPRQFIEKIPEDGLSGLTDEENLGFTYAVLDRYIREGVCDDADCKAKIDRLHEINRHKLEPIPCYEYRP